VRGRKRGLWGKWFLKRSGKEKAGGEIGNEQKRKKEGERRLTRETRRLAKITCADCGKLTRRKKRGGGWKGSRGGSIKPRRGTTCKDVRTRLVKTFTSGVKKVLCEKRVAGNVQRTRKGYNYKDECGKKRGGLHGRRIVKRVAPNNERREKETIRLKKTVLPLQKRRRKDKLLQ